MKGMKTDQKDTGVFGGGCFWYTEAFFSRLKGVLSVMPGYAGGTTENPTYEEVSLGTTGHAEVIKVEYNPAVITYDDLLTVFFATHNPTTPDRQGNDIGPQYRSVIFYTAPEQKLKAETFIRKLKDTLSLKVVTELKPLDTFCPAEEYHRNYYAKNHNARYCQLVIDPKLAELKRKFRSLLIV